MAIPAVNAAYNAGAPTGTNQVLAFGGTSVQELVLIGSAQLTLDGSLTAATINFIDGTKTLNFTPSAVLAFRQNAGTDTAAASISVTSAGAPTNAGFVVNISAAGSNAQLLTVFFAVIK